MQATLDPRVSTSTGCGSGQPSHIFCVTRPEKALCGADIRDDPECPDGCGCADCVVCRDLDVWPCPVCGADYDCEAERT